MVLSVILGNPTEKRAAREDGSAILNISENFGRTIQGENFAGIPSVFLRLQHCTLACVWCDTLEVWKYGNPYSVNELLDMWEYVGLIDDFKKGHHLILTGGSPLKQEAGLLDLIKRFQERFDFLPFIEVENECTLVPSFQFFTTVSCWNNSPKLGNSGMKKAIRYKKDVLTFFKQQYEKNRINQFPTHIWYKFVVTNEEEWEEIVKDFIEPGFVQKEQIVLMPEGQTREQLQEHYSFVVDLCCREGVRMTDRMHVTVWNAKTGV